MILFQNKFAFAVGILVSHEEQEVPLIRLTSIIIWLNKLLSLGIDK